MSVVEEASVVSPSGSTTMGGRKGVELIIMSLKAWSDTKPQNFTR